MVIELFDGVKNKDVEASRWEEPPFRNEQLGTCSYIVPIKDVRNLNIVFPAPDMTEHYKSSVGLLQLFNSIFQFSLNYCVGFIAIQLLFLK